MVPGEPGVRPHQLVEAQRPADSQLDEGGIAAGQEGAGECDEEPNRPDEGGDGESITVACKVTTLDAALAELDRVALLKIDIEGAELLALKGGAELIARTRPAIVCEVDAEFLRGFGQQPSDVIGFLSQWDYRPHRYDGAARRLELVEDPARIAHANVVFLTAAQRDLVKDIGA